MIHILAFGLRLNSTETATLVAILLMVCLIAFGLIYLFASSAIKTAQVTSKNEGKRVAGNTKKRVFLTIIMPILTIISFFAWSYASNETKSTRYLSPDAFPISSVLGNLFWLLFVISLISAIYYYSHKK